MRSLLKVLVPTALTLLALGWGMGKYRSMKSSYEHRLARETIQREFLERAPWVWSIDDPDLYRQEARGLFKWYVDAIASSKARFPSHWEKETAYLDSLDERRRKGRLQETEYEGYKESYHLVAEIWERIRKGSYTPVMTGHSASLRIDFLEPTPALVDGQQALRGQFVVWGAQRTKTVEKIGLATQSRIDVHASFRDVVVKLADGKGKAMGELTFGLPFGTYVPVPEVRIADFPPLAFVGSYAIPLVPHEAETMEMTASLVSRATTGTQILAQFTWETEVPASWKLRMGEAWEGAGIEHRENL